MTSAITLLTAIDLDLTVEQQFNVARYRKELNKLSREEIIELLNHADKLLKLKSFNLVKVSKGEGFDFELPMSDLMNIEVNQKTRITYSTESLRDNLLDHVILLIKVDAALKKIIMDKNYAAYINKLREEHLL